MAVASRSRQITTPAPYHSVFTGRMPFLPPNQQRQCTEGMALLLKLLNLITMLTKYFQHFLTLKINYVPLHKNWCILSEILAIEMFTILNIIQPPPF